MPRVVPSQVVAFIGEVFGGLRDVVDTGQIIIPGPEHVRAIAALLALLDQLPDQLLLLDDEAYPSLVIATESLRVILRAIESPDGRVQGVALINDLASDVHRIRELLERCPDEIVPAAVAGLDFIDDEALRDSIRRDVAAANSALLNGEWKAATVLAGAACEALLLWRVQRMTPVSRAQHVEAARERQTIDRKPPDDPTKWTLHQLLEVAAAAQVILQETRDQLRLAKDFRNLIHPGREQRVGQRCDRATALSALAAMEHTIRDVSAQ